MKTLIKKLESYITTFLQNCGKHHVVMGLSGGLDSATCLVLATKALGAKNVTPYLLPTKDSPDNDLKDALILCESLGVKHELIYIDEILKAFLLAGGGKCLLKKGNLCARIRMCLLYDASAAKKALVLGCSNKSELTLGYGTIYGDLAYAFNPIGDIYKSDLYALAAHLGVPKCFLEKAPSANLWPGQSDEEELGFSYEKIDEFLKALEAGKSLEGFDKDLKKTLETRIKTNAFKASLGDICKL